MIVIRTSEPIVVREGGVSSRGVVSLLLRFLIAVGICCLTVGCKRKTLAEGVSQRQALQIVVVLNEAGFYAQAERGRGNNPVYSVSVEADDYSAAAKVLYENDLPSPPEKTISELLEGSSFLPESSQVQSMRMDRVKSLEIEQHFRGLPGVRDVRVLVRSHVGSSRDLRRDSVRQGVSVVLVREKGQDATLSEGVLLDQLATNFPELKRSELAVTVLDAEDVKSVAPSHPATGEGTISFLWVWRVRPDMYFYAAGMVGLLFFVAGVVGGAFGFWYATLVRSRAESEGKGFEVRLPPLASSVKEPISMQSKADIGWG